MDNYILDDDGNPVPEPDTLKWARWYEGGRNRRRLAWDDIDGIKVSTVFLGIDHSFGAGPPVLWETMIFGGGVGLDEYQERYTSRPDALAGHAAAVAMVHAKMANPT